MFSNTKVKTEAEEVSTSNNIIGKGTLIEGNIETMANIRIEGRIKGNLKTKAKLAMGESSLIEGNILAQNAEIAGEVIGIVEVTDLLVLKATANIKGDIITNKISIEIGASFNGSCKMGAIMKEINLSNDLESTKKVKSA